MNDQSKIGRMLNQCALGNLLENGEEPKTKPPSFCFTNSSALKRKRYDPGYPAVKNRGLTESKH